VVELTGSQGYPGTFFTEPRRNATPPEENFSQWAAEEESADQFLVLLVRRRFGPAHFDVLVIGGIEEEKIRVRRRWQLLDPFRARAGDMENLSGVVWEVGTLRDLDLEAKASLADGARPEPSTAFERDG
jgi:hypothetical protein